MPQRRRAITAEDYYRLRFTSDPQISPNGEWIACVISQASREEDRMRSDIWLISTDGKSRRQLTNRSHRDVSPRWSPDGAAIAFLAPSADADGDSQQIRVISVTGGESTQITTLPQGVSSPVWSPDGKQIAFLARDPEPKDRRRRPKGSKTMVRGGRVYATDVQAIDQLRYRSSAYLPREEWRQVYVVGRAGGRPRKLTGGEADHSQIAWSPDGREIAFVSLRGRDPDWDIVGDVWRVPVKGGRPRRLTHLEGGASEPAWSPDGKHLAFVGSTAPTLSGFDAQIWVLPRGGKARPLTRVEPDIPHALRWSPDGNGIYYQCYEGGFHSLWRADLEGETQRVLARERCVEGYSVARRDGSIAYVHSAPEHPADVFVCGRGGEREVRLTDANGALLRSRVLGRTRSYWCKSSDGTDIQAWVVSPAVARRGRKYPLIVMVHGGPHAAYLQNWHLDAQVLAARGYFVVYSNPRGSRGYGRRLMRSVVANWGVEDSQDVLAAVEHVVAEEKIDPRRLGVMGGSFGGFMTTWLLGTTDRFRAGVALCAAADMRMWYYSGDVHRWCEEELGGPPWERPEDYRRVSSTAHAHKIKAPLLLLHAVDDKRVPISCSDILHTTLKRQGVESVYVRYPFGGHGFPAAAPRFACDSLNRTADWFYRHMGAARLKPTRP